MTYTFIEHQKNVLIGVVSGLLAGIFFAIYDAWKSTSGIWKYLVPVFVVLVYYVFVLFSTYWLLRFLDNRASKKPSQ